VIGAGIAGTICARMLRDHAWPVTVFDKARGPGGRVSTRRAFEAQFDHGAQYFTARDPWFRQYVATWQEQGVVAEWLPRIVQLDAAGEQRPAKSSERFVGFPSMSAVARHLASDLDIRTQVRVGRVERHEFGWAVADDQDHLLGEFDAVIAAVPAQQAAALLSAAPELRARAQAVDMTPCWAMMLELGRPVDPGFDAAFVDHPAISWIARDGSKPGRPSPTTWIIHAAPVWSAEHLERDPADIVDMLRPEFANLVGAPDLDVRVEQIHRWRFALPTPLDEPCLFDVSLGVGACGDWCGGPRVEGAFLSGSAMAGQLLENAARLPMRRPMEPRTLPA
jgi:predicted NAD/FAD-dependent oxidoreductase